MSWTKKFSSFRFFDLSSLPDTRSWADFFQIRGRRCGKSGTNRWTSRLIGTQLTKKNQFVWAQFVLNRLPGFPKLWGRARKNILCAPLGRRSLSSKKIFVPTRLAYSRKNHFWSSQLFFIRNQISELCLARDHSSERNRRPQFLAVFWRTLVQKW